MPETTYRRLFAAARFPPPAADPIPTQVIHASQQPNQRQTSLHTFWSISSQPPPNSETALEIHPTSSICVDCEAPLAFLEVNISMGGMDDEDAGSSEFACRSCGTKVCRMCAVVEVGVGRECLQCRTSTRKRRVGGIGWMS